MPIITLITLILILLPVTLTGAQEYTPLVGIPGVADPNSDFSTYINSLYILSISIAALLAVIKIIIAGVKWMMTDVVTSKSEAKKDIRGALTGLLVVLSAVLILTVINSGLTKFDFSLSNINTSNFTRKVGLDHVLENSTNLVNYNSIHTDSYSRDEQAAFRRQCIESGRLHDTAGAKDVHRCYKKSFVDPATHAVDRDYSCLFSFTADFGSRKCTASEVSENKVECESKGGTYTPDDLEPTHYGLCVRERGFLDNLRDAADATRHFLIDSSEVR